MGMSHVACCMLTQLPPQILGQVWANSQIAGIATDMPSMFTDLWRMFFSIWPWQFIFIWLWMKYLRQSKTVESDQYSLGSAKSDNLSVHLSVFWRSKREPLQLSIAADVCKIWTKSWCMLKSACGLCPRINMNKHTSRTQEKTLIPYASTAPTPVAVLHNQFF